MLSRVSSAKTSEIRSIALPTGVDVSKFSWIVSMSVNVGLGGIFLAREDLSLAQLVRSADAQSAADDKRAVGG